MQAFEELKRLIMDIEEDLRKAEGGNKAAGTRVRSVMQQVKTAAQQVREQILEKQKTSQGEKTA
jgi:hypothetical protein